MRDICWARHPREGYRCEQPDGHDGKHRGPLGTEIWRALADRPEPILSPLLPYGVKMLREHLCLAQWAVNRSTDDGHAGHSVQAVIDWCDLLRPTGTDGKHGDLHTPWCGCEDVA